MSQQDPDEMKKALAQEKNLGGFKRWYWFFRIFLPIALVILGWRLWLAGHDPK